MNLTKDLELNKNIKNGEQFYVYEASVEDKLV